MPSVGDEGRLHAQGWIVARRESFAERGPGRLLTDLGTAFDPISPVTFQFERMETTPRFATITRPNNPALLVRLRVDMEERGGTIEILLPHTTLEPVRGPHKHRAPDQAAR